MRYVENKGALYRIAGPSNAYPNEVWSPREKQFVPHEGDVPKPVSWGQDVPEEEAEKLIQECGGQP